MYRVSYYCENYLWSKVTIYTIRGTQIITYKSLWIFKIKAENDVGEKSFNAMNDVCHIIGKWYDILY
ncbi:unnamed protein product [Rhizophagus irregularis]|nr:unnamed protein product [Rhizophagus irregularis]CAB5373886.1 unnamed protein product [Rhizophagus irregularis]